LAEKVEQKTEIKCLWSSW